MMICIKPPSSNVLAGRKVTFLLYVAFFEHPCRRTLVYTRRPIFLYDKPTSLKNIHGLRRVIVFIMVLLPQQIPIAKIITEGICTRHFK